MMAMCLCRSPESCVREIARITWLGDGFRGCTGEYDHKSFIILACYVVVARVIICSETARISGPQAKWDVLLTPLHKLLAANAG
jgi:hypothetical protein